MLNSLRYGTASGKLLRALPEQPVPPGDVLRFYFLDTSSLVFFGMVVFRTVIETEVKPIRKSMACLGART